MKHIIAATLGGIVGALAIRGWIEYTWLRDAWQQERELINKL